MGYQATMFFVGLAIIFYPSPLHSFKPNRLSDDPSQEIVFLSPDSEPDAPEIPAESEKSRASRQLSDILSPFIFSDADPFQYLLRETSKIESIGVFYHLGNELWSRLKKNQFSERYIPYAQALYSIVRCRNDLNDVKWKTDLIRSDPECSTVPSEISSSPEIFATGLFSFDIFSDPDSPTKILNKLLEIPKNDIPNLKIWLQDFTTFNNKRSKTPAALMKYIWYADELLSFLRKESLLKNLRRDMVELQRITTINRQSPDSTSQNNELELPAMSTVGRILSTQEAN